LGGKNKRDILQSMKSGEVIRAALAERILILDGAMGSMIQAQGEAPVGGCNDELCRTKPEVIGAIHEAYLEAGADIIETCSLNATAISLKDYGLEEAAYDISRAAAGLARKAADKFSTIDKPRFAAGSMGPTARGASYTADLDNPERRAVTWDCLEAAYYDNARGLLDGGADLLIIETFFDSLNAKAALYAVGRLERERNIRVPVIVSATISPGGRLLTGQTVEAFYAAVLHAGLLAVSLNCSFGAEAMRPHLAKLARVAACPVCVYPNAGLPDRHGVYSETPAHTAAAAEAAMKEGLVNIIGACCGSTPAHIAASAGRARACKPRRVPAPSRKILLSGTQLWEADPAALAALPDGNVLLSLGSAYQKAVDTGDYLEAAELANEAACAGADGATVRLLPLRPDKAPDPASFARNFIFTVNCFSGAAALPLYIESSAWEAVESAMKSLQGRSVVRYTGPDREDEQAEIKRYGAVPV
jgi:5-methyltetrahydrofolate--homocysteine methyltransferase